MNDRVQNLMNSIHNFLEVDEEWAKDDKTTVLTQDYELALTDMVNEFSEGDLPSELRAINRAVENLRDEWEAFESYVTQASPHPRSGFWAAVSKLRACLQAAHQPTDRPLESVKQLKEQGVSLAQIAEIYAHEGNGPFMKRGIPQTHLIEQELAEPGSVLGKNFVHPARLAQERKSKEARERWKARAAARREEAPKPGAETFEELFAQGLTAEQISLIKVCSIEEVEAAAKAAGVTLSEPENLAAMRAPHEPALLPSQERELNAQAAEREDFEEESDDEDDGEGDDEDPDSNEESEEESLKEKLLRMADEGKSANQIAKELGMKLTDCAQQLKEAKKERDEAQAAAQVSN